ncbi:unnamed protein product [Camellia sinensis]
MGFGIVRDVGNGTDRKESATSRLNDHINFLSGPASCSRFMPQITENGNESIEVTSQMNGHLDGDEQTNTEDMLDLAVEYRKEQLKILTDKQAKCTCSSKQKEFSNPTS